MKNNYKRYEVKLHLKHDADIIEHLQEVESVNALIKKLLENYFKSSK